MHFDAGIEPLRPKEAGAEGNDRPGWAGWIRSHLREIQRVDLVAGAHGIVPSNQRVAASEADVPRQVEAYVYRCLGDEVNEAAFERAGIAGQDIQSIRLCRVGKRSVNILIAFGRDNLIVATQRNRALALDEEPAVMPFSFGAQLGAIEAVKGLKMVGPAKQRGRGRQGMGRCSNV